MEFRMIQMPPRRARWPGSTPHPARLRDDTCSAADAQNGGRHRRAVPTVGFV